MKVLDRNRFSFLATFSRFLVKNATTAMARTRILAKPICDWILNKASLRMRVIIRSFHRGSWRKVIFISE